MATDKLKQLQLMEQNMQALGQQKQQFATQLAEAENAEKELGKSDTAYKIVGSLMVKAKREDLLEELGQKKEILNLRVQSIEKQENNLRSKFKALQKEVLEGMKDERA